MPTNAEQIREWVADNFYDIGEFRTTDVTSNIEGVEIKASSNVSSALQSWFEDKRIVKGIRLRRLTDKGKTAVWICEKATKSKGQPEDSVLTSDEVMKATDSESFNAKVIDRTGSSFLVKYEGKLYKVTPFKY